MTDSNPTRAAHVAEFQTRFQSVIQNIGKVIKGKENVVAKVLITLISGGHAFFCSMCFNR